MIRVTGCNITDFFDLADQLPQVTRSDNGRYWRIAVSDQTFGYLWEPTRTVGLKQTIPEQLALVAERPETFEVQFTAGAFGWVVCRLEGVERDELAELTFEAWRLTAPAGLVDQHGDRPPR
ncbi:MAG: MmcQ/YjbR family DNA-binding protein [Nocardioidaceae bacterium]